MLHKTKGIVINYIPYRETSVIVRIYTEKFGIQSYIENGVRSSKGRNKIALFQPMTLLDMVVYHDEKKDLHRISEMKCLQPLLTVPYEVRKSSISIFINEILSKSLKEQEENEALFFFLSQALFTLDELTAHVENFHLIFLAKLSFYLGFAPQSAAEILTQFNELGVAIPVEHVHINLLDDVFASDFTNSLLMPREVRNHILDILIMFYRIHQDEFGELRSLAVLREVLH